MPEIVHGLLFYDGLGHRPDASPYVQHASMRSKTVGRHALMPPRMTHMGRNLRSDLGIAPYVGGGSERRDSSKIPAKMRKISEIIVDFALFPW